MTAPNCVRVLLVDDEEAITSTLGPYLERAGFEVVVARDGDEASERAAALDEGADDYLMTHPGETHAREHLLATLWGFEFAVTTRAVDRNCAGRRLPVLRGGVWVLSAPRTPGRRRATRALARAHRC